jgi:cytoskeletal protein RodZ
MDWTAINWLNLSVLTASAFLAALLGSFVGRRNYALTAFLSALIFAAIYIGWFGYLEQQEPTEQQTGSPQPEAKPSEAPAETPSEAATDEPTTEPAEETAPTRESVTEEPAVTDDATPPEEPANEEPTSPR